MKFLIAVLTIFMAVTLTVSQNFFGRFPSHLEFAGGNVRDPRQNRGPVLFPPSPPNPVDESSGVIVGASGYGFVPPQQQSRTYYSSTSLETPATSYATFNYYRNPYPHRFSYF